MSDISSSIIYEYFQLTHEYQAKYGLRTVVLLQVGAFFEVYALRHPTQPDTFVYGPIQLFTETCHLNIADKKIVFGQGPMGPTACGQGPTVSTCGQGPMGPTACGQGPTVSTCGQGALLQQGTSLAHTQESVQLPPFPRKSTDADRWIKTVPPCTVVMAGVRDYQLDKYVHMLTDHGCTAVVYVQEKNGKHITRVFQGVYSPGTYLGYDTDALSSTSHLTNHIMCIWIDHVRQVRTSTSTHIFGISMVNILTGAAWMFEHHVPTALDSTLWLNPTALDELERCISTHSPSEVILIHSLVPNHLQTLLQCIGLSNSTTTVHTISMSGDDVKTEQVERCTQQTYIQQLLTTFYSADVFHQCMEFQTHIVATQSLCYLFHFIQEHNPDLVRNIAMPTFSNTSHRVSLANHTLRQLNILEDSSDAGRGAHASGHRLSSVSAFLNRCVTAMGKRRMRYQLTHPTSDVAWLEREYALVDWARPHDTSDLRKRLGAIRDLEKMARQLTTRRLYPSMMYHLYHSLCAVYEVHEMIQSYPGSCLCINAIQDLCRRMNAVWNWETCQGANTMSSWEDVLFHPGVSRELDAITEQQRKIQDTLIQWQQDLGKLVMGCGQGSKIPTTCQGSKIPTASSGQGSKIPTTCQGSKIPTTCQGSKIPTTCQGSADAATASENQGGSSASLCNALVSQGTNPGDLSNGYEYIKWHETDKGGISFQITKKRGIILKKALANAMTLAETTPSLKHAIAGNVPIHDIRLVSATTSNDEIEFPALSSARNTLLKLKEQFKTTQETVFRSMLDTMNQDDTYTILMQCAEYVAQLDVILCKAHVSNTYHYVRPILSIDGGFSGSGSSSDEAPSFVRAEGLRHILIEHIQTQELYVTNDVSLGVDDEHGSSPSGILLYGTNAVGKTSLIRALGICVIMAQAGWYVPCTRCVLRPYRAIFSRILGNDNLFKGLSTFAVEMSELRLILNQADDHSLVLGDELCSGTETESALSIFAAGIQWLKKSGASFLFATHFHEIIRYEEIQLLMLEGDDNNNGGGHVCLKHMSVIYDRASDSLIYDRRLQEGPGNRMYGLEVCKSLHLPPEFLEMAYTIRNKYHSMDGSGGGGGGTLSHPTSHYNVKKVRGMCEMCQMSMGEEIHHLQPQQHADKDGYIGNFHKNHVANLMSICATCHDKIHTHDRDCDRGHVEDSVMVRKKTTKGKYVLTKTTTTKPSNYAK